MKKTDWADVIGKIDPAYVAEAEQWKKSTQKKANRRHFMAMAACVCVLCIGAAVSFELWKTNEGDSSGESMVETSAADKKEQTKNETAMTADVSDQQAEASDLKAGASDAQADIAESQVNEKDREQIIINETAELQSVAIDMACQYEVSMNTEELEEYYGVTVFPKNLSTVLIQGETGQTGVSEENGNVPAQTQMAEEKEHDNVVGIVRYGENGNVVDDNNTFFYESEDGTRSLSIGVRTTESGIITEFVEDDLKTSDINGNEVTIARLKDECYLAIFEKDGVKFTIETKNFTEEELLFVLRQLC